MKYPLGFAIIEWFSGGHSEAVIYQDREGKQMIVFANWVSGPSVLEDNIKMIKNIITDIDDIHMFLVNGDY